MPAMEVCSYLESAQLLVVYIGLENLRPRVLLASPSPHVLAVAIVFRSLEDASTGGPHDNADTKETHSHDRVICCPLLCSLLAFLAVCDEDRDREE